jgi:hypothetical protein
VIPATPAIQRFLAIAAGAGLAPPDAVRLAIERELILIDADPLGLGIEATRYALGKAAAQARPTIALTTGQGAYVRALAARRPLQATVPDEPFHVAIPDQLLARSRGLVTTTALDPDAVDEMIAWEIAAALAGRSMTEWALKQLAVLRAA